MGRARRNQRDAIRSARAKRRKLNKKISSDDDDDSGTHYCLSELTSKPTGASETATGAIGYQKIKPSKGSADQNVTNFVFQESKPSSTNTEPTISNATAGESSAPVKSATIKKPLDKIERMRLKKQQQKARRKEKKAAREAVAASSK
mmetsp:Transcript_1354/g.1826  ORF Transcript_1354/g.1826 Transcript_1354/m.1826 type:complete len:147 (-) Transcript_1354:285-725(-)